ncbi:MAG: RNA pseudouridine synthase [Burkholderiaceae bacterium]|nr:RNA pseudouridine synthase [Burkholderiaceae bacterium]
MPPGLALVHADAALLVFDKPAGLLAVPGRGEDKQDCLAARAQAEFPDARVVHRLDMATSGLIVLARGAPAQRALNLAFEKRQVHKQYEAVVAGRLEPAVTDDPWNLIDLPLIVDWPNRPRSIVDHAIGKPSRTRWRVLGHDPQAGTTRVLLEPVTGRSHQLRVHLLALGHPILGDPLYAPAAARVAAPRLLLHARRLALFHPVTGEPLVFDSPPPF